MRYLGIDFGLKRVGLATSEYGQLAEPWKIMEVTSFKDAVLKIQKVITEEKFDKVIVGLPEGKIGKTILGFIKALKSVGFDIEPADENLSSKQALSQMLQQNTSKSRRRFNDDIAASIILQGFLDSK